ncbi:alpha/beta hydrolase [Bacillus thuringiensis serovar pirenaica]|uniref:alpha/beta hydrolase n=1 Tax=Bacillus cereus group TaxID=86661 RepID=UPI000A36A0AB|nr:MULTISPECIES: alpha/beta hydrolase [Bacillus cereus group]MCC2385425.1 HNH endonuclease [Bacillus cereus]MCU5757890.1 HNH endonuclease [Bacillus cereus]OUB23507.1 alpha/beta hydrolase [Bacillus thuringiensis serovar pirenaica]
MRWVKTDEYKTKQQKRKFYDSGDGNSIREQVKKRDNYEYQECKRNGRIRFDTNEYSESAQRKKIQLVVHHIKELALDIDNFETICVDRHNKEHGRIFKKKINKWEHYEKW